MNSDKKFLIKSAMPALTLITLMWLVKIIEELFGLKFTYLGLLPHDLFGLIGIFSSPLIHSNFNHLVSNTFPLLFLTTGLFYFYQKSSKQVFILVYILPGIFVWFFGRESYHIGASGLVYGLAAFIFFSGVIRRDTRSIALSLLVIFLYGGMIWGVLPVDPGISWEYHLFGSLWGVILSFVYRKSDPYIRYDWENESDETDIKDLEISYDDDF